MSRRASYMYGNLLPADPKGQVGAGLGMTTSAGTVSLIPPTHEITKTGQGMHIAGLDFEFLLAPDTEAPAEMHWFIAQYSALTAAENCCHTLHNTYSIRGTKIRDPLAWSKYLDQTIELWGDRVEVLYGMHHWPAWGRDRVLELLSMARDGYRFINDETLRLANHGLTPSEIAEQVRFPPGWRATGRSRLLRHAQPQRQGDLRQLPGLVRRQPRPPQHASAGRGGPALRRVHGRRRGDAGQGAWGVRAGDYRWVAEVVNHVVFADPDNADARALQAAALEQLGYQAESGPGATSTSPARTSCATGCARCQRPPPPAPTWSAR